MLHRFPFASRLSVLALLLAVSPAAQDLVQTELRIAQGSGGFPAALDDEDRFGAAVASLGDLDGDGLFELVVGAPGDDDGGAERGASWILFLDDAGSVRSTVKVSDTSGGFAGALADGDRFGSSVCGPGDLDRDGIPDLIVGADGDDERGTDTGALWVLFLQADGTVRSHHKIAQLEDALGAALLGSGDRIGASLAGIGDLDGNGTPDIALGVDQESVGGTGALYIVFLKSNGTLTKSHRLALPVSGPVAGDRFAASLTSLGDLDQDGHVDLAAGAPGDDTGGNERGAVWVLFLDDAGALLSSTKLASGLNGMQPLADGDAFGAAVLSVGDIDFDRLPDLHVGLPGSDDGGTDRGALRTLLLTANGRVNRTYTASSTSGGFAGTLADGDAFGSALGFLGRINADEAPDIVVGTPGDSLAGNGRGAAWNLFLTAASIITSNGSGVNPEIFQPGNSPTRIGTLWQPFIDSAGFLGEPLFHFMGVSNVPSRMSTGASGELLISVRQPNPIASFGSLPGQPFRVAIPPDPRVVGVRLYTQGGLWFRNGTFTLTNRLEFIVGL